MIKVDLSSAELPVDPGGSVQLTITVANKQDHDDRVSLEIEGIDVEWYALPVPTVNVAAGESDSARVLFKIARTSESLAGTYPFVVRARGMESGETGLQQASLVVRPFSSLQIELNPKRAASTFLQHSAVVDVTISNLGNRDETLTLAASDPEDGCAYEFETDRVTLKPGRSEAVPLVIEPVTRPVLGATRLYGYTVTARSAEDSYVSANVTGQLERRALLSILAAILLVVVILCATGYALFRPTPPAPPAIHAFTANPEQIVEGEDAALQWDVSNPGERSVILPGNIRVRGAVGEIKVRPKQNTTYTLVARNAGAERRQEVTVRVLPRPVAPEPVIKEFKTSQRRIHQGDAVTLSWNVEGATIITLNPIGKEADPKALVSFQDRPEQTTTYILTAKNPASAVVAVKALKVEVVPPGMSIAEISAFRLKPESIVEGQKATLTWMVEGANSIEVDNGVGSNLPARGKAEVNPLATTVYSMTATDAKGNVTRQSVTLTVRPPEGPAEGLSPGAPPPPPGR